MNRKYAERILTFAPSTTYSDFPVKPFSIDSAVISSAMGYYGTMREIRIGVATGISAATILEEWLDWPARASTIAIDQEQTWTSANYNNCSFNAPFDDAPADFQ